MKLAVMLAVAAAAAISASAQEPLEVKLWDNATAPHSNAITQPEQTGEGKRISHTTEAVLYIYRPAEGQAHGTGCGDMSGRRLLARGDEPRGR